VTDDRSDDPLTRGDGRAAYVFAVEFRVSPRDPEFDLSPETFEGTLRRRAPPPGEEGWLFF
jgi:hypothetical protein